MAAHWKVAATMLALTVSTAMGACGSAAGEDKGGDSAQYAVQSNLFCESLRTALVPLPRPTTHARLVLYLARADDAVRTAAAGLHDALATLGANASPQRRSFDREVDTVAEAIKRLSGEAAAGANPAPDEQRTLIDRAEEVRKAFAIMRRVALAADLRRCGLGGDDLADAVLFTTYRVQYLRIQEATFRGLRRAPFRSSDSLARYLSKSRRYLKIRSAEYRRIGRLTPPADLRAAHDELIDRFAEAIRADRRLQSELFRGKLRTVTSATARLERRDSSYFAAERRLRRLLDGRTAP